MNRKNSEAMQLRELLFDQMQRLNDPKNDLEVELKRASAIAKVGTVIVNSHKQEVDMMKAAVYGKKFPGKNNQKQLTGGK